MLTGRNHGFLLTKKGWKLSPAYDINPTEKAHGLSLNISEDDNSLDFELCMDLDRFDFVLKGERLDGGGMALRKINVGTGESM